MKKNTQLNSSLDIHSSGADEASFNISTNDPLVIKKNILGSKVIFLATKIDREWTNNIFNEFIYDIFIELVFNQIVVNES